MSDFDFWNVVNHELNEQDLLTDFLKKIIVWANRSFWAQKLAHPHNSGLAVKMFQKFAQ